MLRSSCPAARRSARSTAGSASCASALDRVLNHYRFDAPPQLSVVPRGAWVVVIVDGSRSFDADDRRAGLAALAAALSHQRDGRVAVLVFDRKIHRLFPGFRGVGERDARPGRPDVRESQRQPGRRRPRPGRRHPRGGIASHRASSHPARHRSADAHGAATGRAEAAKRRDRPRRRRPRGAARCWTPDDDNAWSDVVERTGGVVWRATATADPAATDEMRTIYEDWARPKRLRHVRIIAPGRWTRPLTDPATAELPEGEAIERFAIDREADSLGRDRRQALGHAGGAPICSRTAGEARLWAALVFGSDLLDDLTEPEMMVLARRGRAVSPVTSYLAIEPGVRPSTEGLEMQARLRAGRDRVLRERSRAAGAAPHRPPEVSRGRARPGLAGLRARAARVARGPRDHGRRGRRRTRRLRHRNRCGPVALPGRSGVGPRSAARIRSALGPLDRGASAASDRGVGQRPMILVAPTA